VVELIFGAEEAARFVTALSARGGEHPDVAARAKAAALSVIDDHGFDLVVGFPALERVEHRRAHRGVERM